MKTFHSFGSYLRRFRSGAFQDPVRDWLLLLGLSILAFLCIIGWNVWAFNTVAQGGSIGAAATTTPAVFNSATINNINNVFQLRAAEDAKYVSGVYSYSDPSQ